MRTLKQRIREARRREERDDHLGAEARSSLVNAYRLENPATHLPVDLDDAFVQIVFD